MLNCLFFSVNLNVKIQQRITLKKSYLVPLISKLGAVECYSICFSFSCPRTNLPLLDICGSHLVNSCCATIWSAISVLVTDSKSHRGQFRFDIIQSSRFTSQKYLLQMIYKTTEFVNFVFRYEKQLLIINILFKK